MKTATLICLTLWVTVVRGQANETFKACQTVMTCFQDAEDEIDKCLSILVGERSASGPGPTEPPKPRPPPSADDCMTPVKEKIKQKKVLDKERVQEFKTCLTKRIDAGAEDVDPRKYRYCTTVTGRYQNKSSEAGIRFKRQAVLPELPPLQSTHLAGNSSTAIPPSSQSIHSSTSSAGSSSAGSSSAGSSLLPIHSSSASAIPIEPIAAGEAKNATSGGGVDPFPALVNSTQLAESSSQAPQHSSASIPLSPSSSIGLNSSPISSSSVGLNSSPLSIAAELSTQEHTSPKLAESSPPPQPQPVNGSIPESSTLKPIEASTVSHSGSSSTPLVRSASGTTTEIEYEYSGSSGGSSSEVGAAKPQQTSNPIVDTLNQQHNISEPAGPPVENATKPESTVIPPLSSSPNGIHPPGLPPSAKAPGVRQNGQRAQKPQQASDIDANGADQDNNQQRVKIEVLREARRRLSEFKGCMARARIKREECKPLVRCCPDSAVCHLNYESSDLHNKVHKLESEILQGRQECLKRKRALNKDELADAMDQIDAEELISDDSVVSQIIF